MRFISILIILAVALIMMPIDAKSLTGPDISLSSEEMARGDVLLITVKAGEGEPPKATWMEKEIAFVFNRSKSAWQGFLPADLNQKAGTYEAIVRMTSSGFERHINIQVTDKDYGVRRLTLPKEKVDLNAESLKRVKKEAAVVSTLWKAPEPEPEWKGIFLIPVAGEVVGIFGKRSIINNMEKSPHTGVDLSGNTGDPVKAVNNGKVVLIADHFFTGNTVFLNHGGGIITMYCHLNKILVKDGDRIEKGQTIGLVGATGRATGPHLHWGMRVNGARVNPLTLIDLSKKLEE